MEAQEVHALRHVNLTIERGEFVAIMGPSGSGKSTFMNLVGCLDKPTGGSYRLDGIEVSGLNGRSTRRHPEPKDRVRLPAVQSVGAHVGAAKRRTAALYTGARDRERIARECLRVVGLEGRMGHTPSQLSGGQQQRVAIARSLVNDPPVIMADEPTGALDSRTSEEIMAIFQRLNRDGKTIILVTHELDIAQHARRVIRFKDGHLISDEPVLHPIDADEVLSHPATPEEEFAHA